MLEDAFRMMLDDAVRTAVAPLTAEIAQLRRTLDARLPERWLSRAEAAEALGCSVDTVDRQIAAGMLPSRKIGSRGVRVRLPISPEADEIAILARKARTG